MHNKLDLIKPKLILTSRNYLFENTLDTRSCSKKRFKKASSTKTFNKRTEKPNYNLHIGQYKKQRKQILESLTVRTFQKIDIEEEAAKVLSRKMVKKQDLKKFFKRKKEMMLIQMNIDDKNVIIKDIESKMHHKKTKLEDLDVKIKNDLNAFNHFLKSSKIDSKKIVRKAENETNHKLKLITKLKNLKELKTMKINVNNKLLENVNKLLTYKLFYDKIFISKVSATNFSLSDLRQIHRSTIIPRIDELKSFKKTYKMPISRELWEYLNCDIKSAIFSQNNIFKFNKLFNKMEEINLNKMMKTQELTTRYETDNLNYENGIRDFENEQLVLHKRQKYLKKQIALFNQKKKGILQKKENDACKIKTMLNSLIIKLNYICPERNENPILMIKQLEAEILTNKSIVSGIDKRIIQEFEKKVMDQYKLNLVQKVKNAQKKLLEGQKLRESSKYTRKLKLRKDNFRSYHNHVFNINKFLNIKIDETNADDRYFK